MNALEKFCQDEFLDPAYIMNVLQDAGVVSDEAIHPKDLPQSDTGPAIHYLNVFVLKRRGTT